MNGNDMLNSASPAGGQAPIITRKIGSTTYEVSIHFSETSKENMDDKILRLIRNDSTKF